MAISISDDPPSFPSAPTQSPIAAAILTAEEDDSTFSIGAAVYSGDAAAAADGGECGDFITDRTPAQKNPAAAAVTDVNEVARPSLPKKTSQVDTTEERGQNSPLSSVTSDDPDNKGVNLPPGARDPSRLSRPSAVSSVQGAGGADVAQTDVLFHCAKERVLVFGPNSTLGALAPLNEIPTSSIDAIDTVDREPKLETSEASVNRQSASAPVEKMPSSDFRNDILGKRPRITSKEKCNRQGSGEEGLWRGRNVMSHGKVKLRSVAGLRGVPGPDFGPFFRGTALDVKAARKSGRSSGSGIGMVEGGGSRLMAVSAGLQRMGVEDARTPAEALAIDEMANRFLLGTASQEVPRASLFLLSTRTKQSKLSAMTAIRRARFWGHGQ